jgi:putative transposase
MLTYKFRLYPTIPQEKVFRETIETCRRLYNSMLADRIGSSPSYYDQSKALVEMKKDNKYLKAVHSQVLQDVALRVDKSFQRFFSGIAGHPKYRRARKYNSFTYPQYDKSFRLKGNHLKLGKIGWIKLRLHRQIEGAAKTATIIRDINQWYVAFSVDETSSGCSRISSKEGAVGIDVGISNIAAMSDGSMTGNPRFLKHAEGRIKSLQRQLSRRQRGSNRREKSRILLAKAWRKVRRQRDDFAHKLSDQLTKTNKIIVFEDLQVDKLVHNRSLASAIMDAAWYKLRQMTVYKAERRGGRVLFVNPSGTSQKCYRCRGEVPKELSERTHRCDNCGEVLDRDVNAARNILNLGLERARAETEPLLIPRRRIRKFGRGSEKPLAFSRE